MCGIVGAVADRNVVPLLLDGLKRLEYRGYDSAGIAVIDAANSIARTRKVGKVRELESTLALGPMMGTTGIAHTRWATHGGVTENNAHPHICWGSVAVVCNGIIENHESLRQKQLEAGFEFTSDTDTEVIVHQIYSHLKKGDDLLRALRATMNTLDGAYALAVISPREPGRILAARNGPPLLLGACNDTAFVASDIAALLTETNKYTVMEDGDIADINRHGITIYDYHGKCVERPVHESHVTLGAIDLGDYRHYMLKEIYEQPNAVVDTLEGRLAGERVLEASFGHKAPGIFDDTDSVSIVACGTSYHAALVAKYWLETHGVSCDAEIASEFRYRSQVVRPHSLFVTISQSGETADTLAALAHARDCGFHHSLTICNVPESSLVRASDLALMTHAGPEIGVASTKAFTTQLTALLLLTIVLARRRSLQAQDEASLVRELRALPVKIDQAFALNEEIRDIAEQFADKEHALFLGRGAHYPIALEGALKLKEISYIHAEGYAAGELKHGPLALVDANMPVVAVAPNNQLLEKLKSNIQEVRARGGRLIVFADPASGIKSDEHCHVFNVASVDDCIAPIIYTIPLQLLAYHVAVIKGTDIDKPRNLAKSVTVE